MGYVNMLFGLLIVTVLTLVVEIKAIKTKPDIEHILTTKEIDGFKDFQRARSHFYTEVNGHRTKLDVHELKRRKRDTRHRIDDDVVLHIETDSTVIELDLHTATPILDDETSIIFRRNDFIRKSQSAVPDCFYTGQVRSEPLTTATVALCDSLEGAFQDGYNTYWFESLKPTDDDISHDIIIGKREENTQFDDEDPGTEDKRHETLTKLDDKMNKDSDGDDVEDHSRSKRQVTTLTVETVIFVDEAYVNVLKALGFTTDAEFTQQLLVRLHGMQAEWSKSDVLGYNVVFAIKLIEFWQTDPSWYTPSTTLQSTLTSVCSGAQSQGTYSSYDSIHLFTGVSSTDVAGKAFTGKVCVDGLKCAVSTYTRVTEFTIPSHEFGHSMNMGHDSDEGCSANDGLMGSKPTGFSPCSVNSMALLLDGSTADCLKTTDVSSSTVVSLESLWPGMLYTDDEICEYKLGPGYRFRYFPISLGECSMSSCIQMSTSANNYGTMVNDLVPADGRYCATGQVCWTYVSGSSYQCITWAATGLNTSLITSVPGGWSDWSAQTSCSRTCGTGVQYKQRYCNNPKPQNSPTCAGDEYELTTCNADACSGDSATRTTLIQQRAAETCTSLISNGYISSSEYQSTGDRFTSSSFGQCEVTCDAQSGFTKPTFQRFGLMPDGTPCSSGTQTFSEQWDLPGTTGASYHCVQGYCIGTGCDGLPDQVLDRCGVCGGTNSTCTVVDGVYSDAISGDTKIHTIPTGAFNIFFFFDNSVSSMQVYFLEIWGTASGPYIISYGFNGDDDTRSSPVTYAGTQWYYYLDAQFLWALGNTTMDVDIYVTDFGGGTNIGIHYGYSYGVTSATTTTSGTTISGATTTTTSTSSTSNTATSTTPTSNAATSTTSTSNTATSTTPTISGATTTATSTSSTSNTATLTTPTSNTATSTTSTSNPASSTTSTSNTATSTTPTSTTASSGSEAQKCSTGNCSSADSLRSSFPLLVILTGFSMLYIPMSIEPLLHYLFYIRCIRYIH